MLKRAAPNGAARDSIFVLRVSHTARCICPVGAAHWAAIAQRHEWNFPLDPHFAGRNRTGGQAIVAPRIAGENSIAANLPPHSDGKVGRLKAADKTASCRNERSLW